MPTNIEDRYTRLKYHINNFMDYYNQHIHTLFNNYDQLQYLITKLWHINVALARLVPEDVAGKINMSKENLFLLSAFDRVRKNSELKSAIIRKYYNIFNNRDIDNEIETIINELSEKDNFKFTESSTLSPNQIYFFGRR